VGIERHPGLRRPPEAPNGIRRVQVGCGPHNILADWWNVDIRGFQGIDEVMDVTQEWRWVDLLDCVYGEHFLEHLDIRQAISFLVFAGRALVPGGKIRLSTPALEYVLKTHFSHDDAAGHISETFAMNRAFHGWGHKFLYSREMLQFLMRETGYGNAEFCKFGESSTEGLKNVERHGRPSEAAGYPAVWIIEAERTARPIAPSAELLHRAQAEFGRYVDSGH